MIVTQPLRPIGKTGPQFFQNVRPRHQFGRYSDAAPWLWNHMGFDRSAMQERGEGTVVLDIGAWGRPFRRSGKCLRFSISQISG